MEHIVFLHGWGANSGTFTGIAKFFESTHECIFIDFDCNPGTVMDLDDYADYVEAQLIEKRVTRCHIIAHSFGARVAVLLARRNPHMVKRMVLTGAAGLKPRFNLKIWSKIKLYKMFGIGKGSFDYARLCANGKRTFKNIIHRDLSFEISYLETPTLLIFGAKDKSTPIYMAKRWTKLCRSAILKTYAGAGHFAFLDDPQKFIHDAYKFLETQC
ncbi:MAG: alpha/beta hydrolase [Christensenellaceae bacterium]|jgi:pimeloyl-ACP methyl ester carboxylesterase|nr:alpha/beta hydrolase [Christensenellaceae bacterium]